MPKTYSLLWFRFNCEFFFVHFISLRRCYFICRLLPKQIDRYHSCWCSNMIILSKLKSTIAFLHIETHCVVYRPVGFLIHSIRGPIWILCCCYLFIYLFFVHFALVPQLADGFFCCLFFIEARKGNNKNKCWKKPTTNNNSDHHSTSNNNRIEVYSGSFDKLLLMKKYSLFYFYCDAHHINTSIAHLFSLW